MGGVPGAKATRVTTVTSLLASDLLGAAGRGEGLRGRDLGGAGGQGGKGDRGWVPGAFGVILPRAPETRAAAGPSASATGSATASPSASGVFAG